MRKQIYKAVACALTGILLLAGCGQSGSSGTSGSSTADQSEADTGESSSVRGNAGKHKKQAPKIDGLTFESSMDLEYAEAFDVYYYEDGYKLIDVHEDRQYLVVPEGKEAPKGLGEDIVVLEQPLDHIYMAATAVMSLFDELEALGNVAFSGVAADGWYVNNVKTAMNEGEITYAGKYSEPDYEMLVNEGCDLAVESTMIRHTPKVQEMIEDLEIPVFVDYSSYESHPLGRTEWVKLYGAMLDKEEQAETFFEEESKIVDDLEDFQNTEKTVAYFYVNSDGSVVVRKSEDYVPVMIEIAGGRYVFDDLKNPDSNAPSVKLTMEEFYATAVDADYLIYNGTIDGQISSISDLEAKNELFAEFKAVKDGNVWYTGKNLYQATDKTGELIRDIHLMLTGKSQDEMTFLEKMK